MSLFFVRCSLEPKPLLPDAFGKIIEVVGVVSGIPNENPLGQQFLFKTQRGNLQLGWYTHEQRVHPDERWHFFVKLKPIHGYKNPGGMDANLRARQEGVVAHGYVVKDKPATLLKKPYFSVDKFRESISKEIRQVIPNKVLSSIIVALSIGDKNTMSPETWYTFQRTGTSHLMAISGLHVGLIVAASYFIASWFFRLFPRLLLRWPAQQLAWFVVILATWGYGLLVGLSLPTQRAVIMTTVFAVATILSKESSAWLRLGIAFFVIIAWQPLSVTSVSFWLSFLAIFWMSYSLLSSKNYLRVKILLMLGLIPISLFYFKQISLVSSLANLIAIPWVTLLIVPICLVACMSFVFYKSLAILFWQWAAYCFVPLWLVLEKLSSWQWAQLLFPINRLSVMISSLFGLLLLAGPRAFPMRLIGVLLLLPMFLLMPKPPPKNHALVTVLDVGQGLSAVIETNQHVLVFDAGPKFPSGFDAGRSILMPYLQTRGVRKVDRLVISHGDNDHIGGSYWLSKHFQVREIFSSIPHSRWSQPFMHCKAGQQWEWDGVHFEMLWPNKTRPYEDNDSSCVLLVSSPEKSLLLTGDIEKKAERRLLDSGVALKADYLVAPHHGSRTSSSVPFVRSVQAKLVIMAVGFQNRFHFPSKLIVSRYNTTGSRIVSTAEHGAVQLDL